MHTLPCPRPRRQTQTWCPSLTSASSGKVPKGLSLTSRNRTGRFRLSTSNRAAWWSLDVGRPRGQDAQLAGTPADSLPLSRAGTLGTRDATGASPAHLPPPAPPHAGPGQPGRQAPQAAPRRFPPLSSERSGRRTVCRETAPGQKPLTASKSGRWPSAGSCAQRTPPAHPSNTPTQAGNAYTQETHTHTRMHTSFAPHARTAHKLMHTPPHKHPCTCKHLFVHMCTYHVHVQTQLTHTHTHTSAMHTCTQPRTCTHTRTHK